MTHQYTEAVAAHYAAYRPPLHQCILKRVFTNAGQFSKGLDVGCGTGRSSVALTEFCERVVAIDPSQSMLDAATPHDAIDYQVGSAESTLLPDHSIDVATFAGSLSYADVAATAQELARVCRSGASVVTYDFDVLLDKLLERFDIAVQETDCTYDHRAGFSSIPRLTEKLAREERVELTVDARDLAHVLLADSARHEAFVKRYENLAPLTDLATELGRKGQSNTIEAKIFYSLYQLADGREEGT